MFAHDCCRCVKRCMGFIEHSSQPLRPGNLREYLRVVIIVAGRFGKWQHFAEAQFRVGGVGIIPEGVEFREFGIHG